uniref:Uncharacterized protein n=1 Tax=Meloidogyne enterolobii TaxID=390850 RepID=A0A6V7WAF2_MELEN|nr:unnamed protein product [Meloidogyne enterolobii]
MEMNKQKYKEIPTQPLTEYIVDNSPSNVATSSNNKLKSFNYTIEDKTTTMNKKKLISFGNNSQNYEDTNSQIIDFKQNLMHSNKGYINLTSALTNIHNSQHTENVGTSTGN